MKNIFYLSLQMFINMVFSGKLLVLCAIVARRTCIIFNPLALEMDIVNILRTKKGNVMKYTTFCRGIN